MASGKVAKRPQPAGRASYHSPPAERIDGRGSPTESTSGSSSTGDEGLTFKCFFKHRDPHHAAKLHSRYKSCNSQFPNVNRLRSVAPSHLCPAPKLEAYNFLSEHIVRAHSLSHNCRGCRHRTTKAKEAPEFQARHAHCSTTSPIQKPLTGVKPVLLDQVQTDALTNLNLHHKKPHDERSRCKKLWDALFPLEQFDPAVMSECPSAAFSPLSGNAKLRFNWQRSRVRRTDRRRTEETNVRSWILPHPRRHAAVPRPRDRPLSTLDETRCCRHPARRPVHVSSRIFQHRPVTTNRSSVRCRLQRTGTTPRSRGRRQLATLLFT